MWPPYAGLYGDAAERAASERVVRRVLNCILSARRAEVVFEGKDVSKK